MANPRRVILKTIDGKVVVRPLAPDFLEGGGIARALSVAGKEAWNRGEEIDARKGHFDFFGDLKQIARADFT